MNINIRELVEQADVVELAPDIRLGYLNQGRVEFQSVRIIKNNLTYSVPIDSLLKAYDIQPADISKYLISAKPAEYKFIPFKRAFKQLMPRPFPIIRPPQNPRCFEDLIFFDLHEAWFDFIESLLNRGI